MLHPAVLMNDYSSGSDLCEHGRQRSKKECKQANYDTVRTNLLTQ